MSEQGYLVISDITGYTACLSKSEFEHAEDSLRDLLTLLLEHTKPPLVLSRLEGDAVISYAPQGSFLQGQTLVETLESTYVAFRQALERMVLNTTCACKACRNIPSLDLKFFVHYGTFMFQQLGAHVELVGSDVNLIHRLTKNSIIEKTGFKAYAVYTQAAVDALGIEGLCGGMTPHTESYEHLGEVATPCLSSSTTSRLASHCSGNASRSRSTGPLSWAITLARSAAPMAGSVLGLCITVPTGRWPGHRRSLIGSRFASSPSRTATWAPLRGPHYGSLPARMGPVSHTCAASRKGTSSAPSRTIWSSACLFLGPSGRAAESFRP